MKKVYLAGKITANGWRHNIFSGLRDAEYAHEIGSITPPPDRDNFHYVGPFFLTCDHSCYHGDNNHGRGAANNGCGEEGEKSSTVLKKCLKWINEADYIFAWIDSSEAFGTIAEIGYAKALGKPIFLAYDEKFMGTDFFGDTWFIQSMSGDVIFARNANRAWDIFVKRYQSDDNSSATRPATIKQINFVQSLLSKRKMSLTIPFEQLTMGDAGLIISHLRNNSNRISSELSHLLKKGSV